jgi:hypothetical protein
VVPGQSSLADPTHHVVVNPRIMCQTQWERQMWRHFIHVYLNLRNEILFIILVSLLRQYRNENETIMYK